VNGGLGEPVGRSGIGYREDLVARGGRGLDGDVRRLGFFARNWHDDATEHHFGKLNSKKGMSKTTRHVGGIEKSNYYYTRIKRIEVRMIAGPIGVRNGHLVKLQAGIILRISTFCICCGPCGER
jgi:hypothetical protein